MVQRRGFDLACMWSFGPAAVQRLRYGGKDDDDPLVNAKTSQSGGAKHRNR